jgi:hypothetical protein
MVLIVFSLIGIVGMAGTTSAGAATIPSSQGTDFWVAFESNATYAGAGPGTLFLFISGNTATSGTVTVPAISFSTTFSVTPGVATTVSIPSTAEDDSNDTTTVGGALHITAGAPVSAYGLNTYPQSSDGFLGLPTPILGTSYLVEGYGSSGGIGGSQFAVVGTQKATTVTITPSEGTGAHTAGVPYTVTLNQGDVYQLIDVDGNASGGDLSGTSITSNAPVAVFAGNDCADVPPQDQACNTLAEEMTPTDTWGNDFLTEPLATRSGDTFRFMASKNGTTVKINGSPVGSTLNAGQFYETILTSTSSVTANNPIQVMQYSNGQEYDGANADPMDITIPPTEQYLNSYTISTEPNGADPDITQNYLNIVAPTSEVSSIDLDGTNLPSSDFTAIPGSSYSGAQVPVAFGSHNISASLPFGLSIYGFGGYDAYGYPGGFTLSPIATVAKVTLAPTTSTYAVDSSACETATVTDQNGNPVSGVRVDFTVTGVNPNVGFAYSGTNGTAQYCYTGTTAGTDTEKAAVGSIASNSATIQWTSSTTTCATGAWPSPIAGYPTVHLHYPQEISLGAVDDNWKLYATHPGPSAQVFTGTVTTNGTFTGITRLKLEGHDRVTQVSPDEITFRFVNRGYLDGFAFTSTCGSQVSASFGINGPAASPSKIILGSSRTPATSNPISFTRSSQVQASLRRAHGVRQRRVNAVPRHTHLAASARVDRR